MMRQLEKVLDVPQPRAERTRQWEDFANDDRLVGEVSVPLA